MDFSNLWSHGGFFPFGVMAITVGVVTVIFSMVGAEIATIAAAESSDPERAVAKAANSVILRIAVFFVGSAFLLATILPWNSERVGASPFVAAFTEMGIPVRRPHHERRGVDSGAELSQFGDVHRVTDAVRPRRTPRGAGPVGQRHPSRRAGRHAILTSSVIGFLCVIAAAVSPDTIFAFLLNSSGAIILFVYLLISISQIVLRYRARDSELKVKMWLFPVLSILTTLCDAGDPRADVLDDALRSQLVLSLLSWAVVCGVFPQQVVHERPTAEEARRRRGSLTACWCWPTRKVDSEELLDELRRIEEDLLQPISWSYRPARSRPEPRPRIGPSMCRRRPKRLPRSGWTAR